MLISSQLKIKCQTTSDVVSTITEDYCKHHRTDFVTLILVLIGNFRFTKTIGNNMGQHKIHQHTWIPDYSERYCVQTFSVLHLKSNARYRYSRHGSSQRVSHALKIEFRGREKSCPWISNKCFWSWVLGISESFFKAFDVILLITADYNTRWNICSQSFCSLFS